MAQDMFDSYVAPVYGTVSATKGVEDKSGRIDTSTLGQIAQGLDVATQLGSQYYGTLVEDEAEAKAYELVDLYKQGHQGDGSTTLPPTLSNESTLVNSYNQGLFNPYEFQMRATAASTELMNRSPGYTKEIAKKLNDVFDRTGITAGLKLDTATYDKMITQQIKLDDKMNALLATYGEFGEGMSYGEKVAKYQHYLEIDGIGKQYLAVRAKDLKNNMQLAADYMTLLQKNGGPAKAQLAIYRSVQDQLDVIHNDPNKSDAQKLKELRDTVESQKAEWLSKSYVLQQFSEQDPILKQHIADMNTMFTMLSTNMQSDFKMDDYKARTQAESAIVKAQQDTDFDLKFGRRAKIQTMLLNDLKIIGDISKEIGKFPGASEAYTGMVEGLRDVYLGKDTPNTKKLFNSKIGETYLDYSRSSIPKDPEEINVRINTSLSELKNLDSLPAGQRFTKLTQTMQALDLLPKDYLIQHYNTPDWRIQFNNTLNFYKAATIQQLKNDYKGQGVQIDSVDATTGKIYSNDPKYNRDLERVNTYVSIYAKLNGLDPKDAAADIITNNFMNVQ